MIKIKEWPFPITVNTAYAIDKKRNRKIKSQAYKIYLNECTKHWMKNRLKFYYLEIKKMFKTILHGEKLELTINYYFEYEKVYTKNGDLKKIDTSNRIKVLEDVLGKFFEFDDCVIFKVSALKLISDKDYPYVDIFITKYKEK